MVGIKRGGGFAKTMGKLDDKQVEFEEGEEVYLGKTGGEKERSRTDQSYAEWIESRGIPPT